MATAVLRSQDCLRGRFPAGTLTFPHIEPRRNGNSNPNPNPSPSPSTTRSGRRKRTPVGSQDKEDRRVFVQRLPSKNLIMGQVTILKRGEVLKPMSEDQVPDVVAEEGKINNFSAVCSSDRLEEIEEVSVLCSTERLGPEPEMVPKRIGLTDVKSDCIFAGSVFLTSPPPSSLPLPGFFTKKVSKIDAATTDLRRILRLDLS